MAGFDLMGLLGSLVSDPYQQGGGLLSQWINPHGAAGAGLKTPLSPPPVAPSTGSPFAFRPGLLGDSLLGRGVRGALSGLAGSTGYTGLSALGAGAGAASQAADQRQLFNQQNLEAGQRWQGGQVGLANANAGLVFQAYRMSKILGRPVTPQELMTNPQMLLMSGGGQQPATSPDATQPSAGQPSPVTGALPGVGMQPVYGGGTGGDSQVAQAYGPSLASGTPPPAAAPAQGQPTASGRPASVGDGTDDPYVQRMLDAEDTSWITNDGKDIPGIEEKIAEHLAAPGQAAAVRNATDNAGLTNPTGTLGAVTNFASALKSEPIYGVMQEVKPNYQSVLAAYKQSEGKTGALPSDMDLLNGVLKMMNPNAANLRPNTVESIEEAKGFPAYIQKALQAINGGTGLTPEIRATLKQVADQHMKSYQAEWDQVLGNYRKRATMLPGKPDESQWNPLADGAPAPVTATNAQGQKIQWDGTKWAPLQ